jgi:DNA-binding transcriptional MerR regulator
MTQWYVKDISRLAQISVQTLHHYDRIGLLTPSIRLANGYRLYSEKDLLKLQQIIALKYFGFELSQIKTLLEGEVTVLEHLAVQSQYLEEKANSLLAASQALKQLISDCDNDQSIPWETIIKLIEVYRMTQQLEKTWVSKALSKNEFDEYVKFQQGLSTRFTANEKQACEKSWASIVEAVNQNLDKDPASAIGIDVARRCMEWVINLYGEEHAALRGAVWEKGFKGGYGSEDHGLSAECVEWLDKAMKAYYRSRVSSVLAKIGTHKDEEVSAEWEALMQEMYEGNESSKAELIKVTLQDTRLDATVREWLKSR